MIEVRTIEPPERVENPGFYQMPSAHYHADPCPAPALSFSLANLIANRSPLHAKLMAPRFGGMQGETSARMDLGSAAHAIAIGDPGDLAVIDADDFKTKAAREARDAAIAEGKTPIKAADYEIAQRMARAALPQLLALIGSPLSDAFAETVLCWRRGGWRRTRADLMSSDLRVIVDYKTTGGSAAPDAAERRLNDGGYFLQEAFTLDGLDALDPANAGRRRFFFVMQEQEPPFACSVHEFDEAARTVGRQQAAYAGRWWDRCVASGEWPGYGDDVHIAQLPPWVQRAWTSRLFAEGQDMIDAIREGAAA